MKIKVNQELKSVKGDGIPSNLESKRNMTLQDVMIESLLFPKEKDDAKGKNEKYKLYIKIQAASSTIDLTVEDVSLIKKCIGEIKPPLIMGQAWEMLEGKSE